MTALSIVQRTAGLLNLDIPAAVFSSADQQVIQLRTLMNEEGQALAGGGEGFEHNWAILTTEKTFTTVATAVQTSSVATDYGYLVNESMWNRSLRWPVQGPMSPQDWQNVQAVPTGSIRPNFRFIASSGALTIEMYPTPTAGQTVAYEYVSKNWAQTNGSVGLSAMTADTDTSLLEDRLISLGIRWRYLKAKGLDYSEDFRTYQIEVGKAIARDGGRQTMSLSGRPAPRYRGNLPEAFWSP